MSTLLFVDSDKDLGADVCYFFRSIGHTIEQATDYTSALRLIERYDFDVVICEVAAKGVGVHQLLQKVRKKKPDAIVIVTAEIDTVKDGVRAVEEGAFSLLQKPFSIPELNFQTKRAFEERRSKSETPAVSTDNVYQPYNFIGESPEIKQVFKVVNKVAQTAANVIITGETGTGKELVAGALHYNSERSEGPFVRVNCAALPEQLLESELFGYEKGAFTGADRMRIGRFEQANGGTIFLDEVADMSLFTQAKVLRVIQEKEFERLGSNMTFKTDVRLISATNKDLMELMQQGQFREDLYYRLNVVSIHLPPLRDRDGDIGLLAQFFLKKYAGAMNKKISGLDPQAQQRLNRYPWPGNIRELENTLERAVLMSEGQTIGPDDLNLLFQQEESPRIKLPAGGISLETAEKDFILQALERCDWVQKDAAQLLDISSRVLNYKIKRFGITHPRWKQNRAALEKH
jgi:DNA-binding NtrC family response regulator